MRPYEVMVIFDAAAEPQAVQAVIDRLLETIRASGGNPGAVERWGRRAFAYEVNHKREGYYVLVEFGAEPSGLPAVDRMLSLADEVVRHKVVRLPDKAPRRAAAMPSPRPAGRVAG
ncbi:MAG TPA: 30S ribosomal protein S6 [Acidimicrobiales bacterium]|nr:30S ribosomal protein S6 [Acidimicrobiales bacterium]